MPEGDFRKQMKAAFSSAPERSCPPEWKLVAWQEGRLGPEDRRPVSEHIESCNSCRNTIDDIQAMFAPGEELPREELDRDWSVVWDRLRREPSRPHVFPAPPRRSPWTALVAAAAAVLLITTGIAAVAAFKLKARIEALQNETSGKLAALERENRRLQSYTARNPEPQFNAAIVDLYPRDSKDRSGQSAKSASVRVSANSTATLVLYLRDGRARDSYTLQIFDGAGRAIWQGSGLRRSDDGTLTVTMPGSFLPDGEYTLRLFPDGAASPNLAAEYRLEWRRR